MIGLVREAGRRLFWLHNPGALSAQAAQSVAARLVSADPGDDRAPTTRATVPRWLPRGGREIIPYGVLDRFRARRRRASRRRRARSSPRTRCAASTGCSISGSRGSRRRCREAELHIYAGPAVYGGARRRRARMEAVLARADSARRARRAPPSRRSAAQQLAAVLAGARVMLYRGDPGETFCLALAEAQAMGVPAVVQPLGSRRRAGHRRRDRPCRRATTTLCRGGDRRCCATTSCGGAGTARRSRASAGLSWDEVAARFEALMRMTRRLLQAMAGAPHGGAETFFVRLAGGAAARRRDAARADPPRRRPRATPARGRGRSRASCAFGGRLRSRHPAAPSAARSPRGAPTSC